MELGHSPGMECNVELGMQGVVECSNRLKCKGRIPQGPHESHLMAGWQTSDTFDPKFSQKVVSHDLHLDDITIIVIAEVP